MNDETERFLAMQRDNWLDFLDAKDALIEEQALEIENLTSAIVELHRDLDLSDAALDRKKAA